MNLYRLTQTTRSTTRPAATLPANAHEALVRQVGETAAVDGDREHQPPRSGANADIDAAEGRKRDEVARDVRELAQELSRMGAKAQDLVKSDTSGLQYRQLDIAV
ncbi:MAG: hypothetical protein ACM3SV_14150 [Betaproteobacteria bacterium]